jgi:UDP-N-acetylglucosamine--N-acetylmuramyl-(pentapeptide) pyrophosphoryl-undecaprenol N-acetylglucosamine transferase
VHGVGLRSLPRNLWQLARGVFASRRLLREFRPDVQLFTGGYVAVPMAVAGTRVPTLLYVPDIEPGLALKTLAHFADRIALTAEESQHYFRTSDRAVLTGYPTGRRLTRWTRPQARKALKLSDDSPVLLVLGGSKGARSINRAVLASLPALLELAQVVHVTGQLDWAEVQAKTAALDKTQSARYHAFPYLHEELGAALAAADLAVSRAGASTLGEYPLFGLPSILVPYPYAWRYQKVNAYYLVSRGAALLLADEALGSELLARVKGLLQEPARLEAMRLAVKALSRPQAAAQIGRLLLDLAGKRSY